MALAFGCTAATVLGLVAGLVEDVTRTREYLLHRPVSVERVFWTRHGLGLAIVAAWMVLAPALHLAGSHLFSPNAALLDDSRLLMFDRPQGLPALLFYALGVWVATFPRTADRRDAAAGCGRDPPSLVAGGAGVLVTPAAVSADHRRGRAAADAAVAVGGAGGDAHRPRPRPSLDGGAAAAGGPGGGAGGHLRRQHGRDAAGDRRHRRPAEPVPDGGRAGRACDPVPLVACGTTSTARPTTSTAWDRRCEESLNAPGVQPDRRRLDLEDERRRPCRGFPATGDATSAAWSTRGRSWPPTGPAGVPRLGRLRASVHLGEGRRPGRRSPAASSVWARGRRTCRSRRRPNGSPAPGIGWRPCSIRPMAVCGSTTSAAELPASAGRSCPTATASWPATGSGYYPPQAYGRPGAAVPAVRLGRTRALRPERAGPVRRRARRTTTPCPRRRRKEHVTFHSPTSFAATVTSDDGKTLFTHEYRPYTAGREGDGGASCTRPPCCGRR